MLSPDIEFGAGSFDCIRFLHVAVSLFAVDLVAHGVWVNVSDEFAASKQIVHSRSAP